MITANAVEVNSCVVLMGDTHRFGQAQDTPVHLFAYSQFEKWIRTYSEQAEITATCGAKLRPVSMGVVGVHAVDGKAAETLCETCRSQINFHPPVEV